MGDAIRAVQQPRVAWRGDGRVHIAVRGVSQARGTALARAVELAVQRHRSVSWAVVNAPLGVVIVGYRGEDPTAELVQVVERLEREHCAQAEPAATRPPVVDRVPGAVAALTAGAAGLAAAGAGVALRTVRLPAELGSLVQFVDTQPRLRGAIERAVGPDTAGLVLAAANTLAQSAAQGLGGLAVDLGVRAAQLTEAVLQRDAWSRAEPVLCGGSRLARAQPATQRCRQALAPGPVEQYSKRTGPTAVAAFAGIQVTTGSPRRAAGVALAALPKAAHLGREGFACALGGLLSRRGVVVTDHRVIRRLDRIDTIVVDADILTTGALVVGEVVPVGAADAAEVTGVVHALFDPHRMAEARTDGTFTLAPLDGLDPRPRTGARLAATLTRRGAVQVLGLAQGRVLRAMVGVVPQRAPAADLLLAAAAAADARLVMAASATAWPPTALGVNPGAGGAGGPVRSDGQQPGEAAEVLPNGRRLPATIRGLQAAGAGVLLVSRQRRALAAADCGIGLASADGRPAWGAHILAGDDLAAAAIVIDAVRVAHAVSNRGVRLAQAGTVSGCLLALGGAVPGASRRSLLAVNGAGAIALVSGAWSVADLARRPATAAAPRPPWHAMPADLVLSRLDARASGLTSVQARARWQPDERQPREPSLGRAFFAEAANPLTPILLGGAALSAAIGAVADAVIVSGVCALSALMGSAQRFYTEQSMGRLLRESAVTARVLRDGHEHVTAATGLVPGDVVLLAAGDVVPADCRLLDGQALQVDESSLTGESIPVSKTSAAVLAAAIADRTCMLYESTTVAAGRATAVVVATGSATEMGRSLAGLTAQAPVTGVEARLSQITDTTLPLALGSAGAVVAAGLLRGRPARDTIGAAVGLAVASVPEGLPFLVTAAQLASARRLASRGALVRNPRTIEALGRVNVLCFDKTGTLTAGHMAVSAVSDGAEMQRLGALSGARRQVLAAALRATPRSHRKRGAEHMTDEAVSAGAASAQVTRSSWHPGWQQVDARPFEPSRSYHATLGRTRNGTVLSVKGAPEVILPRCTTWLGKAIGPRERKRLNRELNQLARNGYRVLAVAENLVGAGYELDGDPDELRFAGFVAFGDPVRGTASASIREMRDAGVHIVMLTGDHPGTAVAIARELNVLNGGTIVTGAELDQLDDAGLSQALAKATVIARCTPEHKVRVVRALQADGRVVAMTGDGANDAAAIRLADVGIALGKRGTPAACAAADLVVSDDRLETIISAIVEGRGMWRSVRQAIGILVGGNVGEIGYTLLGTMLAGSSPLSARQLLLVNLLTDLVPALAVALRTPPPESTASLLAEGPDTSLGSALTAEIAVRAAATCAAAMSAWLSGRLTGRTARARTIGLAAVIGAEIGQTLLVGADSPAVVVACLASLGILVAVVQTPGISQFFGCTPLGPVGWAIAGGSSVAAATGSVLLSRLFQGRAEFAYASSRAAPNSQSNL